MSVSSVNVVGIRQTVPTGPGLPPYALTLGLTGNPFPVTPDETNYFFTSATEAIYAELRHFIDMRKGFLLLTGDIGLGKTTLLRRLIASFDPQHDNTALILTSFLNQAELLETIARDFGLVLAGDERRIDHLAALNQFFLAESASGKNNVLFIDDAQALDAQALDVVRQLSNLETAHSKLIQVVLCGQPELHDTLNLHSLRQVKSRIALHRQLQPLDQEQTGAYIRYRLESAGGANAVEITSDGLAKLHAYTAGYHRRIHHLMDRCLYTLMAGSSTRIDAKVVNRAWVDLGGLTSTAPTRLSAVSHRTPWFIWGAAALLMVLGLGLVGARVNLAGDTEVSNAMTAAVATQVPATAFIAAPENWSTARTAFAGLAGLDWPDSNTVETLSNQLKASVQVHHWQGLVAKGQWTSPCIARPMLVLHDAQGAVWNLSFIESHWPTEPLVMGHVSEPLRKLQQHFTTQGWLALAEQDGIMGPRTVSALSRFQQGAGIEPTGQFSPATAYQLSCRLAGV